MNEKIFNIIQSVRPEIIVDPKKNVELFGVLDSLDIIFIVDEIEKQFNIDIDATEINPENFATLFSLIEFVKRHIR